MAHFRYARADDPLLRRFSDAYLQQRVPDAPAQLRSKSRGLVLLCALVRELTAVGTLDSETGVYLFSGPGPSNSRVQQIAAREVGPDRLNLIERALPPKDFFVANPAMQAAQVSLEFGLHGPWMTFHSLQHGFSQACHYARCDLRDGAVPAALVGGMFMLDDSRNQTECLFVQYATAAQDIVDPGEPRHDGEYGPLTALIERICPHEQLKP